MDIWLHTHTLTHTYSNTLSLSIHLLVDIRSDYTSCEYWFDNHECAGTMGCRFRFLWTYTQVVQLDHMTFPLLSFSYVFAFNYVYRLHVCSAHGGWMRASDPLELGLQRVVSHHVSTKNLTRSSVKGAGALKSWAMSPVQFLAVFYCCCCKLYLFVFAETLLGLPS